MENFIKNNTELFNSEEPSKQHFENFKKKLNNQNKKGRIQFIKKSYSIAAVITFLLFSATIANFVYNNIELNVKQNQVSDLKTELNEVELYYDSNFYKELEEFEQLSCKNSKIDKQEILKEVKKFEINYLELKQELERNQNNEFVINAMISNMQSRSEFINKVLSRVKENC